MGIRWRPDNSRCADCSATPTVWAIVNHGTFVCLRCASVHRSLGTHISKPKGCTGTYLWGPDELQAMRPGNRAANNALRGDSRAPRRQVREEAVGAALYSTTGAAGSDDVR